MIQISIKNIPNQSLNILLDNNNYNIRLHACEDKNSLLTGVTAVDIIRNNVRIVSGMRAVSGTPLIPYRYLQDGNFIFTTDNDMYPNWNLFGINQFLIYASAAEIRALTL